MAIEMAPSVEILAVLETFALGFLGISGLLMAGAAFNVIDIVKRPQVESVAGIFGSASIFVLLLGVISLVVARALRGRMA